MFAIISDIHGNLEALQAVLAEIERRQIQHVLCLGDIIGYGPNPMECMDLVMSRSRATLMGNHDFAVMYEPFNFNASADPPASGHARFLKTIRIWSAKPSGGNIWRAAGADSHAGLYRGSRIAAPAGERVHLSG